MGVLDATCNKRGVVGSSAIKVDLVGVQTQAPTIFVCSFFLRGAFFGRGWAKNSDALSFLLTPVGFNNVRPRAIQVQVVSSIFLAGNVHELGPVLVASLPAL